MINPINFQCFKDRCFFLSNDVLLLEVEVLVSKGPHVHDKLHVRVVLESNLSIAEHKVASFVLRRVCIYVSSEGFSCVCVEEKSLRVCS